MTEDELKQEIAELSLEERYDLMYRVTFLKFDPEKPNFDLVNKLFDYMNDVYEKARIKHGFEEAKELSTKAGLKLVFHNTNRASENSDETKLSTEQIENHRAKLLGLIRTGEELLESLKFA